MKRKTQLLVMCMVVTMIATADQVWAGIITFTDRTSFEASITTNQLIDFESQPAGIQPAPLVVGDVSVNATHSIFRVTGFGAPTAFLFVQNFGAFQIDIAPGTNAIGLNIGSLLGDAAGLSFNLENSSGTVASGSFAAADDNSTFLGWTSDFGDLRRLTITSPVGENATIDNITLGTASFQAVPEPSCLAVFGIGACIAGIGAARRRRREMLQPVVT